MKQMMWSAAIGLFAANMLAAPGAAAQAGQPTIPAAHALLKDILPGKGIDGPPSGYDIVEVGFKDDCTMVLTTPNRYFVMAVDFKKTNIVRGTYTIILQRGVTIYRGRQLLEPEGTSTIGISYFVNEESKMLNVFNFMHQQCYAGGVTPFD